MHRILVTAWSLRHLKYFTLTRRGRRGTPYPPPSKEGGLLLRRILATAWSLRHLNCFTLTRRGRRGTPYPPPSKEGGLLLRRILATAWSLRHPSCFTYLAPSFEGGLSPCVESLEFWTNRVPREQTQPLPAPTGNRFCPAQPVPPRKKAQDQRVRAFSLFRVSPLSGPHPTWRKARAKVIPSTIAENNGVHFQCSCILIAPL